MQDKQERQPEQEGFGDGVRASSNDSSVRSLIPSVACWEVTQNLDEVGPM